MKTSKNLKWGLIIGVHDRTDDLDAHLDIISFCPIKPLICIINSNTPTTKWENHLVLNKNCKNFNVGPLLALCHGLRACHDCEYVVYRNADDWLFNHDSVLNRLDTMHEAKAIAGGYNWLSVGTMNDFAMNELTCHVPSFLHWVNIMENEFQNSSPMVLCETKIARWIRKLATGYFYRLPNREQQPGIGHEVECLQEALKQVGKKLPHRMFADNNRFFNRQWQLLGHHNNQERGHDYGRIRHEINYHEELEKMPNFARWLDAWTRGLPWNQVISKTRQIIHGNPVRKITSYQSKQKNP